MAISVTCRDPGRILYDKMDLYTQREKIRENIFIQITASDCLH